MATFREAPTDLDRSHCSWEKGLLTQSTARRVTNPWVRTQLLSWTSQWSKGRKPSSWRWPTTRFTGPISPTCDRYVQYLLMGANRIVLNQHRRGLQPLRCRLTTYPLPDLPNQLSPLSPSGPASLYFNQAPLLRPQFWIFENLWPPRRLSTTRPSTVAYIYA
jgi:hypothetical protein